MQYINRRDFLASFVVFLVALPLCMGIALASGVSPAQGLVTGIIGGLVTGYLAGSPLQVSGPAAGLAVLVYEIVQTYGLAWLGFIVLAAGVLQYLAGHWGWGRVFQAVSPAVIKGMLAGIGILIFASQFHVMLDDQPRQGGLANLLSIPEAILKALTVEDGSVHHLAAIVGIMALVSLIGWDRFKPKALELIPAPLVAVACSSAFVGLTQWQVRRVEVPTQFSDFIVLPSVAVLESFTPALLFSVFALAFIASAETLLCASATDGLHEGQRTDYNQELKAQGVGNILCGFLGALPMTGVIVRSSANIKAGAISRQSAILHGLWLGLLVFLAPGLLALIPTAALAAVLVYIGFKLVDLQAIRNLHRYSPWEVGVYLATVLAIVSTDLLTGVLTGLALALMRVVLSLAHLEIQVDEYPNSKVSVVLSGTATFVSLPKLMTSLGKLERGREIWIDLEPLLYLDYACLNALEEFQKLYERQGGRVEMEPLVLTRLSSESKLRLVS